MFDHRTNICRYLENLADAYEASGQREAATLTRAHASNLKAEIDIRPGAGGVAAPAHAIIAAMCEHFGGTNLREVLAPEKGSQAAIRVRFASMWVAKKKLGWGDERLAGDFRRDRSTITAGIQRAEQIRAEDTTFRFVTDNATAEEFRCENCQHSLLG